MTEGNTTYCKLRLNNPQCQKKPGWLLKNMSTEHTKIPATTSPVPNNWSIKNPTSTEVQYNFFYVNVLKRYLCCNN